MYTLKNNNTPIIDNNKIQKITLDDNIQNLYPFSHSKYKFVIPNSIDLKSQIIQYAESCLNRINSQILLSELLMDIDIAIQIELSIFEYALIYCSNNIICKLTISTFKICGMKINRN